MTDAKAKRRLRIRRKRRGETLEDLAAHGGTEVVAETGCCLVEAVTSAGILIGLVATSLVLLR